MQVFKPEAPLVTHGQFFSVEMSVELNTDELKVLIFRIRREKLSFLVKILVQQDALLRVSPFKSDGPIRAVSKAL